jgi:hypothetical protein
MSNITRGILLFLLPCNFIACAQAPLSLTQPVSGLRIVVVNKNYPLLKILLPGEPSSDRGIEVEFPEHVTGVNMQTGIPEHLYLVSMGDNNIRTLPEWKIDKDTLIYKTTLNKNISLVAKAHLEPDGVRYTYSFVNHSAIGYDNLQAVTCVKLYSEFSDTLLERTYVHHSDGFDLLASETPERLTMPLSKWLPCRYLVSYTWPIPEKKVEKRDDGIIYYNKSRRVDQPFIATISHDKKWIAATWTKETGNLWTNPERSCQHADPSTLLKPGDAKTLMLKTFLFKGSLDDLVRTHIK